MTFEKVQKILKEIRNWKIIRLESRHGEERQSAEARIRSNNIENHEFNISWTELIIDVLLHAVQGQEYFEKDFWPWMEKKGNAYHNGREYLVCGKRDRVELMYPNPDILLGHELKFFREIFIKELERLKKQGESK